ncbi:MAG: BamA/TamA family outer membrane protein [Potamolinea sp.]
MRLSPLLAAVLAASATIGLSKPVSGQVADQSSVADKLSEPVTLDVTILKVQPRITSAADYTSISTPVDLKKDKVPVTEVKSATTATTKQETNPTSEVLSVENGTAQNPTPTLTPTPTPTPSPATPSDAQTQPPATPEARVLVGEVVVRGAQGQLEQEVFRVINTRPGQATTRSQLQADVNAVFATGFFAKVDVQPDDTPLGVRITFIVEANPVLRQVTVNTVPEKVGQRVLTQEVINQIFGTQYGQVLNLNDLRENIKKLNQWYKEKGYDLAQVVNVSKPTPEGNVTLVVAEGVVEDIRVRFLNKERQATNEKGEPVRGRTRNFIITREVQLRSGDVFNRQTAERDLRRVFGLGIFEDVQLSFAPGTDPSKVVVVVDVIEKNTGSLAAGAGISSASGLFGSVSYQEQNLGGNHHILGAEVQVGQRELLFDLSFTDPWIAGDPYRTSYSVNFFRRRSISLIFEGGDPEVALPDRDDPTQNGDRPRVLRTGGALTFTRPFAKDVFSQPEWVTSLGLQYQRVSIRDSEGDLSPKDRLGNDLSFSKEGKDDLFSVQLGAVRDRRNSLLRPTSGSLVRVSAEQSIPIGLGNIMLTRLRGNYSYYIPVNFTNFSKGPQALAFNIQGGTIIGDLPPYEAFSLGGSNSVRGYGEGDVGAGRSFIQGAAEYRFPLFSVVGGALFVDFATDLGTGSSVPGNPGGVRGKPGSGVGFGLGVRVQSPLGPIRVDYGFNDRGDGRLHFGIGERF